jgi:hypothetical protein
LVNSSVGWVFDFVHNHWFSVLVILTKFSEPPNHQLLISPAPPSFPQKKKKKKKNKISESMNR